MQAGGIFNCFSLSFSNCNCRSQDTVWPNSFADFYSANQGSTKQAGCAFRLGNAERSANTSSRAGDLNTSRVSLYQYEATSDRVPEADSRFGQVEGKQRDRCIKGQTVELKPPKPIIAAMSGSTAGASSSSDDSFFCIKMKIKVSTVRLVNTPSHT